MRMNITKRLIQITTIVVIVAVKAVVAVQVQKGEIILLV